MSGSGKHDDHSSAPNQVNHGRSGSRASQAQTNSTARSTRVNTIPAWARNLPADEFPDDEDDYNNSANSNQHRPPAHPRRRSIASILKQTASFTSVPNTPTTPSASAPGPSTSPRKPTIRRTSASSASSDHSSPNPHTPLQPPKPAFHQQDTRRPSSALGGQPGGWWTFTLPTKHLHHQADLEKGKMRAGEEEDEEDGEGEEGEKDEKGRKLKRAKTKSDYHKQMSATMVTQLAPPGVFSMNQTQTPGWSAPWTPFHRSESRQVDPFSALETADLKPKKKTKFEQFFLHNIYAPLVFRAINLALNVSILGIASHIRLQEARADVIGVIGSSTLMAIVVAPLAITHIFVNLYIEYFGMPIGLWRIRTKMTHTFSELIFICLWSSTLSLAFDDLFTSSLECTGWTPYRRYNSPPANVGSSDTEGTLADHICSQQIGMVTVMTITVVVYILVLVVSLFRIFAKVSRKS